MSEVGSARNSLVKRILEGDGEAPAAERRAAFTDRTTGPAGLLVNKVVRSAFRVTDEDVASARNSGLSEDQIFEIVVCAAVGEATRQYEAAITALESAIEKE